MASPPIAMACPQCGDRMITLVSRRPLVVVCCRCGRPQVQPDGHPLPAWFRSHGPVLLVGLLLLALSVGMTALQSLRRASGTDNPAALEAGAPQPPE